MGVIVSILGFVVALIGAIGLAKPRRLTDLVERWQSPARFRVAVVIRLVLGVVLLAVAPGCRIPALVQLIGALTIAAALAILLLGRTRLDSFIAWWLRWPGLVRTAAAGAVAFGALLVYAGA